MKRIFNTAYSSLSFDLASLLLRLGFGILMIPNHGYAKLMSFQEKKDQFMDFLGFGGPASMALAIFAEFFCSVLLVFGLFTRLATIPLIITTLVILSVHQWEVFGKHELVPAFLTAYLAILLLGPGKYSLDSFISSRLKK